MTLEACFEGDEQCNMVVSIVLCRDTVHRKLNKTLKGHNLDTPGKSFWKAAENGNYKL